MEEIKRFEVTIWTDGACSGNPGPGGYAAILQFAGVELVVSGNEPVTTNNRMELRAVIAGIRALKKPCEVQVISDSTYVVNGITTAREKYLAGWRGKNGELLANADLWQQLLEAGATGHHKIKATKVAGHAGDPNNERCDALAKKEVLLAKASK